VVTGPLNGARMLRDLHRLRPDVVVLAGCGIVAPEALAVPPGGVFSVHPGLLPWTRGSSPSLHSLSRGVPLGATAFRVDPGIDTGPVVARRLLPVRGGETLDELRAALLGMWVEMTAELVTAAAEGHLGAGMPQGARFPLGRHVDAPAELAAAAAAVEAGVAKSLFERWRPFCAPDLSLPPPGGDALLPQPVAACAP
jgi:methionyl-tRNA formyltransferase